MSNLRAGLRLALAVLLVDQFAKWAVVTRIGLPYREAIDLLPVFRLVWVENRGVSMGYLVADTTAQRWLLVAFTAAIAAVVGYFLSRETKRPDALALGAVLGGALGNIVDRVRLGFVADFLNLHFGAWSPFYVFNVADAAISIGVVLLVIRGLFLRGPHSENVNV